MKDTSYTASCISCISWIIIYPLRQRTRHTQPPSSPRSSSPRFDKGHDIHSLLHLLDHHLPASTKDTSYTASFIFWIIISLFRQRTRHTQPPASPGSSSPRFDKGHVIYSLLHLIDYHLPTSRKNTSYTASCISSIIVSLFRQRTRHIQPPSSPGSSSSCFEKGHVIYSHHHLLDYHLPASAKDTSYIASLISWIIIFLFQ